jgi:hypothetical protein
MKNKSRNGQLLKKITNSDNSQNKKILRFVVKKRKNQVCI